MKLKKIIIVLSFGIFIYSSQVHAFNWNWLPWNIYKIYQQKKQVEVVDRKIERTMKRLEELKFDYNKIADKVNEAIRRYRKALSDYDTFYKYQNGGAYIYGISMDEVQQIMGQFGMDPSNFNYNKVQKLMIKYNTHNVQEIVYLGLLEKAKRAKDEAETLSVPLNDLKSKIESTRWELSQLYEEKKVLLGKK